MNDKEFFGTYQAEYNGLIRANKKKAAMKVIDRALRAVAGRKVDNATLSKFYAAKGKLYYDLTNHSMALDCYFKALHLVKEEVDKIAINFYIANCYMGLKDADNAIRLFTWLLEQNKDVKNRRKLSFATNDMGGVIAGLIMCYAFQGKISMAREIISRYFRTEQLKTLNKIALMDYYHAMGEVEMCEKDYEKAEENFRQSMMLAAQIGFRDAILAAQIHLAEIEIVKNNPQKALNGLLPFINKEDEKYICLFIEICLLAGKIYAYLGNAASSEKLMNKCRTYIKNAEPVWLFKLIKEQDELFKLPLTGPASTGNIVRISQDRSGFFEPAQIIGQNEELLKALATAVKIAKTDLPVLLDGETGTGKELFARLLHYKSDRVNGPFVPVNCAGLSESLLESELFGYKKGAFTGAFTDRKGIFEFAAGGTIFLDECAEMPQSMQKDLLRIIEDKKLRRVGDTALIDIDVRIIFATNKSLKDLVAQGKFREDLFYRINIFTLNIPPLRLRKDDIPLLVAYLLRKMQRPGIDVQVAKPVMRAFMAYNWPGNVRELENEIKRIVGINKDCNVIDETMVSRHVVQYDAGNDVMPRSRSSAPLAFREFEKRFIVDALGKCGNNISRTAKAIAVSRVGLIKKMKRLGIAVSREIKS